MGGYSKNTFCVVNISNLKRQFHPLKYNLFAYVSVSYLTGKRFVCTAVHIQMQTKIFFIALLHTSK